MLRADGSLPWIMSVPHSAKLQIPEQSALPGLLSTAANKQCCVQLGDKLCQLHLG